MIVRMLIDLNSFTVSLCVLESINIFMKCFVLAVMLWFHYSAFGAAIVYDPESNNVLQQQGEEKSRSIASLTKLMTAMIVLDNQQSMHQTLRLVQTTASVLPAKSYSRLELLHAMLVHSDNAAAETLASNHPQGRSSFIKAMNDKARTLGLVQTQFADASGLSVFNVSTLREVGAMIAEARRYELIRTISTLPSIQLNNQWLHNTSSSLLARIQNTVVSKTGFTNHAGFCAAMVVIHQGRELIFVILGEPSRYHRIAALDRLIKNI